MRRLVLLLGLTACDAMLPKAPCADDPKCMREGECGTRFFKTGDGPWRCWIARAEDCAAAEVCKESGRCGLQIDLDTACAAVRVEHCTASRACAEHGLCKLEDGACVASDAGCKQSRACTEEGRCVLAPDRRRCIARKTVVDPCADACADEGACTAEQGRCFADSDAHCRASAVCREHGRCSFDADRRACVAHSAADCKEASICRGAASCTIIPGGDACYVPVDPCAAAPECLSRGECSWSQGACVTADQVR